MGRTSLARMRSNSLQPALVLAAAAAMALGLAGCNNTASTPSGMAPASAVAGQSPSAAGGASGSGTQDGPTGGVDNGSASATSPAP
ncbi:MAG: hypothetical protein HIU92_09950 [Proteobacteria bacterium]|nr:hypothetical protein [Pseudomonadota bacterium]